MKTSNKILAGFLIFIFIVPLFILTSFNSKIKKGRFTIAKREIYEGVDFRSGTIKPYQIIKIVGPGVPGTFSCNLIPAAAARYSYQNYDDYDSIKIEQVNDTLLLTYVNTRQQPDNNINSNEFSNISVDLYLPVITNVIAEGANLNIDSMDIAANQEIFFDLRAKASLNLHQRGTANSRSERLIQPGGQFKDSLTERTGTGMFDKLNVKAVFANFTIGPYSTIKELNLQIDGASKVNVDDNSHIDQLSGFISDSCTVEANWKNIRRLATLTKD
ncbi:MAG TPA: hypothetical protein VJ111_15260 [Chitinophagaceae bacterium]|nr:hypothetical protein [Chitinophagaceae bacterium]